MEKQPDTVGTAGEHGIERPSSATAHVTPTSQTDTVRSHLAQGFDLIDEYMADAFVALQRRPTKATTGAMAGLLSARINLGRIARQIDVPCKAAGFDPEWANQGPA